MIRSVPALEATITIGRSRPHEQDSTYTYPESVPENIIQQFCDYHGLRVCVSPVTIFRKGGHAPGINVTITSEYEKRLSPQELRERAIDLAFFLKQLLQQDRAYIALPFETITIGPWPFLEKEKKPKTH